MKADIKVLQSKNAKAKRAEKKKNKVYNVGSERDTPCMGCANSAASGKSIGDCLDTEDDDGNRCTRYDRGGNVCADIPDVLVPVALHLCALRKAAPAGHANSTALNSAIQAWKTGCELYVSGAYNDMVVRARQDGDPEPAEIPASIKKPIQKRALKNVVSTPIKKRARKDEGQEQESEPVELSSDSSESGSGEEDGSEDGSEEGSEESESDDELAQ